MPTNNMSASEQMANQMMAEQFAKNLMKQQERGAEGGFAKQMRNDAREELRQLDRELREGVNKK